MCLSRSLCVQSTMGPKTTTVATTMARTHCDVGEKSTMKHNWTSETKSLTLTATHKHIEMKGNQKAKWAKRKYVKDSTNIDPRPEPNAMANFHLLVKSKGDNTRPKTNTRSLDRSHIPTPWPTAAAASAQCWIFSLSLCVYECHTQAKNEIPLCKPRMRRG